MTSPILRDAWDFRNVLLVERPNGDFGQTMMRQFLLRRLACCSMLERLHGQQPRHAHRRDRRRRP
jgi:1,2-phenylacetyl-CoA epoxidase catalytic subunit